MYRIKACSAIVLGVVTLSPSAATIRPTHNVERIAINDNRVAGGTLDRGVLTIRLQAREGEWHPDRDSDPGVMVLAFGEEGKALQIPGPLIRVTEGTEVRAFVRNSVGDEMLTVHGLYARGAAESPTADTVQIKPRETREVRFVAGVPGTYYYWAATTSDPQLSRRLGRTSQLSGAIVVEPRDAPPLRDRVIVISLWGDSAAGVPVVQGGSGVSRIVMNGKSWPSTERLNYQTGDTVRLRIINAGAAVHPMHLHGFYFRVDSRGDERTDTVFAASASPRMAVTERLIPARTFSLTWIPTRPGNWLFHCHDNVHILRPRPISGGARPVTDHHVKNHALEMMGGPVMGIHVTGRSTDAPESTLGMRRQMRLVARIDSASTDSEPAFGFMLAGNNTSPTTRPNLPGPTIVLKRGEPVSITVVNELPEATAVHWHGIELESYFDGVAGFSGAPGRIAPSIAPRDSFEARFTPPRSGTFIYHTHIDEVRQQQAGLSGALIVVDSPERYDAATDLVMHVTVPRLRANGNVVLLNGSSTPAPLDMRAGTSYRLRFINVHTYRPSMIMKVMRDSTLLTWRAIAKDGMDLPADQATVRRSAQQMGNGETYDFEFTPTAPGGLKIEVTAATGVLLVSMPIRVR